MTRFLLALMAMVAMTAPARAQDLAADLTSHIISITSRFEGADLVAFGTIGNDDNKAGGDIIVTVSGPERDTIIRQKTRIAGIWLNTSGIIFGEVPAFYAMLASKPVETLLSPTARRLNDIGASFLPLQPIGRDADKDPDEVARFRRALVTGMQQSGLYATEVRPVEFLNQKLFRATMTFPANVPVGTYTVTVFLVRHGAIAASQTIPLIVSRSGFAAEIHDFAEDQALAFGCFAVVAAGMAGWIGSTLFRSL